MKEFIGDNLLWLVPLFIVAMIGIVPTVKFIARWFIDFCMAFLCESKAFGKAIRFTPIKTGDNKTDRLCDIIDDLRCKNLHRESEINRLEDRIKKLEGVVK